MHNGFAIALSWPETLCKQAGAWYDFLMRYLGINKQGYYRVGHAAVVLVDDLTQQCRYFDFGRYHAPHGHGRVRSEETDSDLVVKTKAIFSEDTLTIVNMNEILTELYHNVSTHGEGTIYGTATRINFYETFDFIKQLQKRDFIPYGPFIPHGTNCSRFVSSVVQAGKPALSQTIRLKFPLTFTPTPMWNLKALGGKISSVGRSDRITETVMLKQEPEIIGV